MTDKVMIRALEDPVGLDPEYWLEPGKVYEAQYVRGRKQSNGDISGNRPFCIVDISGKRIVLRTGEFEIVGGAEDARAD